MSLSVEFFQRIQHYTYCGFLTFAAMPSLERRPQFDLYVDFHPISINSRVSAERVDQNNESKHIESFKPQQRSLTSRTGNVLEKSYYANNFMCMGGRGGGGEVQHQWILSKKEKNLVNNSLHLWSEEISLVEEWISLDSNSSRVKIHCSTSGISSGSLDIHSKRSDHWRHYPGSENRVKIHSIFRS